MATHTVPVTARASLLRRPRATSGLASWFTTIDHKKIGLLYGMTALLFFVLGGVEALLIRLQLAGPDGTILSAAEYNTLFTMHGTTMVFLVVMPTAAAVGNYFVPLQIGARDVAFPRLNAYGYWTFLMGGLFLYTSFFLGGAPDGGWFGYANLTSDFSFGTGIDFWIIGLIITGIGSLTASINFIVTILNMRAPGMTLMRMPVFTWMILVISFLLVSAVPVITIALILLFFDRNFATNFFNVQKGGDPLLWQHLFWLFGHPEVYILILPPMGIVSEVLPVFARKPLFGYSFVVFSGVAIGFMGWGVWAHHMFSVGLGPAAVTGFTLSTMFIAVPTGVKIFNWLGTLWGGSIRFRTPMLFAIGFVSMFIIGGLSGVTHGVSPADRQQTDTYYVVAHFHYVLFGGAMFGIFSGVYYWFPKMVGKMLGESLGKVHFWLMFIGFNLTFGPMHVLGLQGQPRRTYTYPDGMGWDFWNLVSTVGSFTIALSILVFIINVARSIRSGEVAGDDPWDARTLEWSVSSPPPEHNFDSVPRVEARDDWWHAKYTEDDEGRPVRREMAPRPAPDAHIHMPSPSYWPLFSAVGLPLMGYGFIFHWGWLVAGGLFVAWGIFAWAMEPDTEPEPAEDHDEPEPPADRELVTEGAH
ncbi:MAG TPA: cytochrome c oxidase subunit I [Acidimicrobiia bacterium]|nr:cytochrome c oxidase subunit I [Acidimicrobiia bacterium]